MAYAYDAGRAEVALTADPSLVAVRFAPLPASKRAAALAAWGAGPLNHGVDLAEDGMILVPVGGRPLPAVIAGLATERAISDVRPVFRIGDGSTRAIASQRLLIGIDEAADVGELVTSIGLDDVELSPWRISGAVDRATDVFAAARAAARLPGVTHAEPEFLIVGHQPRVAPGQATGVPAGHAGQRDVMIAVLDDGIDTAHPQMAGQIVDSYDAASGDAWQDPWPWDGHGTASALLAADHVRGCGLLAVRIASSAMPGGPWQSRTSIIADAIDWAWQRGAAVILIGRQDVPPSGEIAAAIDRARGRGRGGRGAVIIAASDGDALTFPASLPGVIAVTGEQPPQRPDLPLPVAAHGARCAGLRGAAAAAPLVAGRCGQLLSDNPAWNEADVHRAIALRSATADPQRLVAGRGSG